MDLEESDSPDMSTPIILHEDEPDTEIIDSSSSSMSCGWGIAEVLICFIPVPIACVLEFFPDPYMRPIPYQAVEGDDGNEEFIRELVFDNSEIGETVPSWVMSILVMAMPFLVEIGLACCVKKTSAERSGLIQKIFCTYFLAMGLTGTITNVAKLYVGYLRPVFYDLCEPDEDYQECTNEEGMQGRKSFPSGHSSYSICGLLLLCLFLEDSFGKTAYQKSNRKAHNFVRLVSVLCYTPILLAFFILLSRVHDNHHHPADVVGGALLGGSIASLIHDIWFS